MQRQDVHVKGNPHVEGRFDERHQPECTEARWLVGTRFLILLNWQRSLLFLGWASNTYCSTNQSKRAIWLPLRKTFGVQRKTASNNHTRGEELRDLVPCWSSGQTWVNPGQLRFVLKSCQIQHVPVGSFELEKWGNGTWIGQKKEKTPHQTAGVSPKQLCFQFNYFLLELVDLKSTSWSCSSIRRTPIQLKNSKLKSLLKEWKAKASVFLVKSSCH